MHLGKALRLLRQKGIGGRESEDSYSSFGPFHCLGNANQAVERRVQCSLVFVAILMFVPRLTKYALKFSAAQLMFGRMERHRLIPCIIWRLHRGGKLKSKFTGS